MAAKRQNKKPAPNSLVFPFDRIAAILTGSGRSLALMLLASLLLAGTTFILWRNVRDRWLASEEFRVDVDDIRISPTPEWIRRSDVRGEVFRYIGPLSIMDDAATERVAEAFRLHPWVERVVRVSKHPPARIDVDLKYRRPVCMVLDASGSKAIPVDARGVCLPWEDFDPTVIQRGVCPYPIVVGVTSTPSAGKGDCWCDERVLGAAEIAGAFGETWRELDLERIVPVQQVHWKGSVEYRYVLVTRRGTRVFWGRPPGTKCERAVSAKTKIERLRRHCVAHGSLEGSRGPQEIDVSAPDGLRILGTRNATRETPKSAKRR
jgi:hypothetical protein